MYYQPGHVTLSKDNLVWINQLWGKEFKVEFEIMVPFIGPFTYNTDYSVFSIYADKGKAVYIRFRIPNITLSIGVSGWSRLNDKIKTQNL